MPRLCFLCRLSKLSKYQMKPCIPGQSQAFLLCSQRFLNDTDLIRQSRKLRCSTKCLFVFYELPCLTVSISKSVWPAFLLLFFSFFPPLAQALSRYTLCIMLPHTHTPPYTHQAHVWCIISLVCGEACEPGLSPALSPCQSQRVCEHQL